MISRSVLFHGYLPLPLLHLGVMVSPSGSPWKCNEIWQFWSLEWTGPEALVFLCWMGPIYMVLQSDVPPREEMLIDVLGRWPFYLPDNIQWFCSLLPESVPLCKGLWTVKVWSLLSSPLSDEQSFDFLPRVSTNSGSLPPLPEGDQKEEHVIKKFGNWDSFQS